MELKKGIDPTKVGNEVNAFLTNLLDGKEKSKFSDKDVELVNCWRAH